jgi:hypothetical protein
MHKLSETYVAALVEKEHLHPIPPEDLYQLLKDLLYAFIGTGNPWKDKNPNRTFYQEFKKALRDDEEHQSNMSLDRFLAICEKLIYKWQRAAFTYEFNTDKRDLEEPEEEQPGSQGRPFDCNSGGTLQWLRQGQPRQSGLYLGTRPEALRLHRY